MKNLFKIVSATTGIVGVVLAYKTYKKSSEKADEKRSEQAENKTVDEQIIESAKTNTAEVVTTESNGGGENEKSTN